MKREGLKEHCMFRKFFSFIITVLYETRKTEYRILREKTQTQEVCKGLKILGLDLFYKKNIPPHL